MLLAAGCLAGLLGAEAVLRILDLPVLYEARRTEAADHDLYGGLPDGTLIYRPNVTFSHLYDPAGDMRGYLGADGRVTYQINSHGLRGPFRSFEKAANTYRVVCLGDSITFGEGVRYEDTYPARLEELLAAADGRAVEVVNAGVQAYGTDHAVALFRQLGSRFQPDLVILGFFLNDATDFYTTMEQFNAVAEGPSSPSLPQFWRIGALLGKVWYARTVQRSYFQTTRTSFESANWEDCKRGLAELQRRSEAEHFRFLVVIFPILWQLDEDYPFTDLHQLINDACREAGCHVVDLLDTFRGVPAHSLWVHPTDQHPNERAHRLAAERIAEAVEPLWDMENAQ